MSLSASCGEERRDIERFTSSDRNPVNSFVPGNGASTTGWETRSASCLTRLAALALGGMIWSGMQVHFRFALNVGRRRKSRSSLASRNVAQSTHFVHRRLVDQNEANEFQNHWRIHLRGSPIHRSTPQ